MFSCFVLVPLFALMILNLPLKGLHRKVAFWAGVILCLAQIYLVVMPEQGCCNLLSGSGECFIDLNLRQCLDNLSRIVLLSIGIIVFVTFILGKHLIAEEERFNFMNLLLIALAGMNGVVLAQDIFSLYVFLEITAVASFILVAFNKKRDSLEGAFKYVLLSSIATVLMLSAVALFLLVAEDTSFNAVRGIFLSYPGNGLALLAAALFLSGLFIKGGLVPFHGWLSDAYSAAPSSVSVLLAGIATKVMGIYTLMRIVDSLFGFTPAVKAVLMFIGVVSMLLGALAAFGQNNMKRMLAYSSISQMGYIVLSFGCGTVLSIAGALFHFFNHAIFKSLLFVNCAAVESRTGTINMEKTGGIAERMPLTGIASVLAGLSTAGVPPLAGFWSKLIIIIALWSAGYHFYAFLAVLVSLLTLGYMLSMQRKVFFGDLNPEMKEVKEAGLGVSVVTIVLALIVIGTGIFFPFIINTFILPITSIFWE